MRRTSCAWFHLRAPVTDIIRVLRPGPRTSVQDRGRRGYQHLGFGVAGSVDERCSILANHLVGNDTDAAVLEATVQGPRLLFAARTQISVVGCETEVTLNGAKIDCNRTLAVEAGDVVDVMRTGGARAYVGIRGGVLTPPVLNSRSTDLVGGVGGCSGRALLKGDELEVSGSQLEPVAPRSIHPAWVPERHASVEARCVLGPEPELFTDTDLRVLTTSVFVVNATSSGMGLRLDGPVMGSPAQILSEGQPAGSVQVPPSGQPIVLLAGRQSLGGYAKVAVVGRPDLAKLAQALPGSTVTFRLVSLEDSVAMTRRWLRELADPACSTILYAVHSS
jgi:biotin-dependent carboxylase-like uncharacterized protein